MPERGTSAALATIARDAGVTAWVHATRLAGEPRCVDLRGDEPVATASLYKLPLALAWADLVSAGELDERARLDLPARSRAAGPTGVSMLLDDLTLTERDAVRLMLAVSDNACAEALIGLIGRRRVNAYLRTLGLAETVIRQSSVGSMREVMRETGAADAAEAERLLAHPDRAVETSQYDAALASASTAQECCRVLGLLWAGSSSAHACVRDAMAKQAWRHRIGSGFPHDDVRVAGKTGTLVRLRHEAAVVEFPDEVPVAVTVLTRAVRPERHVPRVDAAIGAIAREAVSALRAPSEP